MTFELRKAAGAAALAVLLASCAANSPVTPAFGGDLAARPSLKSDAVLQTFVRPGSKRVVVQPGQSIQAAIDAASAGDTILVEPGKYSEKGRPCPFKTSEKCAISITTDDITLIGLSGTSPVVLDNPNKLSIGIGIGKYYSCSKQYLMHGNVVAGFEVDGFSDTGIELTCVDGWEWAYDTVHNDKIYGFYPVWASHGRLDNSVATDATDTGFYVGISDRIRVDHNVAYDNVSGYEFENTIDSLMDHNTAYDNTGGILEFIIPGDPLERSYNNEIAYNVVTENNNANKCTGGTVCGVPAGTGLLMIGGHDNLTFSNEVTNNRTYGIGLTDVCTAFNLTAAQCKALKYNPLPEKSQIVGNTALFNGLDLAWEPNYGSGNCWSHNHAKTMVPSVLPKCAAAAVRH